MLDPCQVPSMLALMTSPTIGLAEAARICGVSESTIRRRRQELVELGASRGAQGWQIPIPALISLGLMDRVTPSGAVPTDFPQENRGEIAAKPEALAEIEALKSALAAAELRASVAEATAVERERIIQVQAVALRMLEASESPAKKADPKQEPAPRRRVWPFRHAR